MTEVWIDTDMGFDDLAAIAMIVPHRKVAGLSIVAGNVPLAQAVRNACAMVETFGWNIPVHAGASRPMAYELVTADYVLGACGMPGQGRKLPAPKRKADSEDGVRALIGWIKAGGRDVLALGPLTNLARLATECPNLAQKIRLVWMGGAASGGNHTASAEFNAAVDPEAVALLVGAGVTIHMVGLDVCRQVTVTLADVAPLRAIGTDRADLLADLLEGYVRIADDGARPMALYDPVAAAALLDRESVRFTPARLDMELDGRLTRGMTVVEWRAKKAAPNACIATLADAERVRGLFMHGLTKAAKG